MSICPSKWIMELCNNSAQFSCSSTVAYACICIAATHTATHDGTHTTTVTPSSCRTTIGDRAFFVTVPRAWNTLPSSVTASETLGTFKRRLKTHLFATSFPFSPNCAHRILFRILFRILTLKSVLEVIFRLLNDTLIIFV